MRKITYNEDEQKANWRRAGLSEAQIEKIFKKNKLKDGQKVWGKSK